MADQDRLRVALAQINSTVGDIDGNAAKIAECTGRARDQGAELVVFPELALTGYPAEDLYLKRHFLEANAKAVEELAAGVEGIVALVGFAEPLEVPSDAPGSRDSELSSDAPRRRLASNALAVLSDGEVASVYRKMHLPNYGVFDEQRYFEPSGEPMTFDVAGQSVGLTVCEDCWHEGPPASAEAEAGARLIANASASPYHRGKGSARERMICERARSYGVPVALCNLVGAQDELVFDGHSFIAGADGELLARAGQFEEELLVCDVALSAGAGDAGGADAGGCPIAEPLGEEAEVYGALVLGLRDYVAKNGFERVVLGLSGGIDSALVAVIAADALGPERVSCVVMPSPHSSEETQADARRIAESLGCELIEIPVADAMESYEAALAPSFDGGEPGIAEENLQARIRGNLVMALSNKFGWLVLATGNKSEMAVGYATLYGDMAGGFAVLKDVPKTLVYELARHRNEREGRELVPASVLERAPSAELRPDQRDEDSLPPYEVLDPILEAYIERDESPDQIAAAGAPEDVVLDVLRLVDRAEYKRRQAPPGIRISPKAFGRDRRLPITNRFGSND